jgi:hypothetical protein
MVTHEWYSLHRTNRRSFLCTASTAAPLLLVPAGSSSIELKAACKAVSLAGSWSGVEFCKEIN